MDEHEAKVAALMRCLEPLHDAFRPLFGSEEGSGGRQLEATVTLVQNGSRRFAITAHHAVKGAATKFIGVREDQLIPWPKKYSVLEPCDKALPDADLAWAHTDIEDPKSPLDGGIPAALAVTAHDGSANTAYLAVGYPVSKGKVRMGVGAAHAKLMVAKVDFVDAASLVAPRVDQRSHLCFKYSQAGRTDVAGAVTVGAHPRGMSGGAVFAVGSANLSEHEPTFVPFLVGILTEFHEKEGILVAARSRSVWEAVGMQAIRNRLLYRAAVA